MADNGNNAAAAVKSIGGVDEEQLQRTFRFAIDKISTQFEVKTERCFLEFEIGGIYIDDETDSMIETTRMKKVKKEDGTVEEQPIIVNVRTKVQRYKKVPTMRYLTYQKTYIRDKNNEKFNFDRVDGLWSGSYNDLLHECITIRVWQSKKWGGNLLIGEATERLINIVDSKVDRVIHVLRKKENNSRSRDEQLCEVRMKCEFQEWFNFQVQLKSWELSYSKEEREKQMIEYIERGRKKNSGVSGCLCPTSKLQFKIRRTRQDLCDSQTSILVPCARTDKSSLRLRNNLKTHAGSGKDAVTIISYPGTRNWLEDEELKITWEKGILCGLCHTRIAQIHVPQQGTLDYGYMLSPQLVRRDACSCFCLFNGTRECCSSFWASLQCCFGPTCNCCKTGYSCMGCELSPEGKLKQKEDMEQEKLKYYMDMNVAGVIACDTLPRYRQQGTVDPVRQTGLLALLSSSGRPSTFLVCKVVRAKGLTCETEFKEMINPSVCVEWGGVQKRTKVIHNTNNPYWDYDVHFKIPDKKGPPRKFEDFAEGVRNSKMCLTVWDEDGLSRACLGYAELDFRQIYEKREEKKMQIFSSDIPVPHLVYETKLVLDSPFLDVTEDMKQRENKRITESEHKYLEVHIYFDRIDSNAVDNRRILQERKDLTLVQQERARINQFSRARALWNESLRYVDSKENRYFAFFGKDEYSGKFHFLPTFIKPMHPPSNMKHFSEIFYYVYSMQVQQKPGVEVDDAKLKRASRLNDPCSPIIHHDVWVWADPYFFFDKKKGDIKDHCVLLCNFLLGLGLPRDQFNAYVCIGTARSKKIGKPLPHVWVMTQENFPHQTRPIVRFWEQRTGETIELDGHRFNEVYDPEKHRVISKHAQYADLTQVGKSSNVVVEDHEGKVINDKDLEWDRIGREMNENLQKFDYNDDAALLQLSTDPTAGIDIELKDTSSGSNGDKQSLKTEEKPIEEKPNSSNVYTAASSSEVQDLREGLRHRQQLLQEFTREQQQRFPNPKDHFWETRKKRATPYESIEVVFNHECLFSNLQQPNPEVIMFEFEQEKRWVEFTPNNWRECFGYVALTPFYEDKAIASVVAPEREIGILKTDMLRRQKETMITYRSYHHQYETIFFDKFEFSGTVVGLESAEDYARERLRMETTYGMRDAGLRVLDAARDKEDGTSLEPDPGFEQLGKNAQRLKNKVQRNLKEGIEFQERLFHFKHADMNRIGDQLRTQCQDLLALPDGINPRYQVFVDVERLPGQVCPVRVLVLLMYGIAKQ